MWDWYLVVQEILLNRSEIVYYQEFSIVVHSGYFHYKVAFGRVLIRIGRRIGSKLVPMILTSTSCLLLWNVGGFAFAGGIIRRIPLVCLFAEPPLTRFWLWTDVETVDILGFTLVLTAVLMVGMGGKTETSLFSNWLSIRGGCWFDFLNDIKPFELETGIVSSWLWVLSGMLKQFGDGIRWLLWLDLLPPCLTGLALIVEVFR